MLGIYSRYQIVIKEKNYLFTNDKYYFEALTAESLIYCGCYSWRKPNTTTTYSSEYAQQNPIR